MSRASEVYRRYLQSEHWVFLRAAAIERDGGKCVKCGSEEFLQVHHLVYRHPWESGVLEDVETVCRKHHRAAHGIRIKPYMLFRGDERFSRVLHRVDSLSLAVFQIGRHLSRREIRFLVLAWKAYPPTPGDSCMAFHVGQVFQRQELFLSYPKGDA